MPFLKSKKDACKIYVIEEQSDEVTRGHRKARMCTLTHSKKITKPRKSKKKKRRENRRRSAILVGWKGSRITENTCFLAIYLKSRRL